MHGLVRRGKIRKGNRFDELFQNMHIIQDLVNVVGKCECGSYPERK